MTDAVAIDKIDSPDKSEKAEVKDKKKLFLENEIEDVKLKDQNILLDPFWIDLKQTFGDELSEEIKRIQIYHYH